MPKKHGVDKYFEQHQACIYVGNAGRKGRGVFAGEHIKIGWLVEEAPILTFSMDADEGEWSYFDHVIYEWGEDGQFGLALGFGSLYNHSNNPNAAYVLRFTEHKQPSLLIWAIKDIPEGKEITINYNGDPDDKTKWDFGGPRAGTYETS